VSLYIDTSCFLKLVFSEPETLDLTRLMSGESRIVVSALTRIEALVQIVGRVSGGAITRRAGAFAHRMVDSLLETAPFEPLTRLLTNDHQQASAARAIGFDVVLPR
jgi:uncharacterized protein with PIN domain